MSKEKTKIFQLTEGNDSAQPVFKDCELEDIPEEVTCQIKHVSESQSSARRLLRKPMYIDFGEGGKTYVLPCHEVTHSGGYRTRDYAIYSVDISPDGRYMGIGVSLLELDEEDNEIGEPPSVRWTHTQDGYRNRGLATRRLVVLNEANKRLFNHRLSSGVFDKDSPSERAWQALTENGLVVQNEQGEYQFIR